MILDPDSDGHWLAVQEFRRSYGVHPDDVFGEDGWVIEVVVDGRPMLGLMPPGIQRLEELAMRTGGPRDLARLDQAIAELKDRHGTKPAPNAP